MSTFCRGQGACPVETSRLYGLKGWRSLRRSRSKADAAIMAEKSTSLRSPAEVDKEAVDRFNRLLKESLEREEKLHQHHAWRGAKFPPFNIEPMPYERQRLATPMTAEDRALRKQWVLDQKLSPNEPHYIPELYPQNSIRRMLAAPWNILFNTLRPLVGQKIASAGRFYAPRAAMTAFVVWGCYYNLKYHSAEWTDAKGWHTYHNRAPVFPGDESYPIPKEKEAQDFNDRGFKKRKVFQNIRTGYTE